MKNPTHCHNDIKYYKELIPENSDVYIIIDRHLKSYHKFFEAYNIIEVESGEGLKTLETVGYIAEKLLNLGADRNAFIIGVGGGIITDLVGFVASIYKRGVRFGFIPTTLLAQVDASLGGKNGVNFHGYKNILGTINQPEFVYVCPEFLKTLPDREFKAGIAEAIKTFILFDASTYQQAIDYFSSLEDIFIDSGSYLDNTGNFPNREILTKIVGLCAEYKQGVVERDEFERGERRLLNLGHTFGHAIEKHEIQPIMHGEAVSIGMVLAAKLAYIISKSEQSPDSQIALKSKYFAEKLESDLKKLGLPTEIPAGLELNQLTLAISKDKKVIGNNLHFILPYGLQEIQDCKINLERLNEIALEL